MLKGEKVKSKGKWTFNLEIYKMNISLFFF